MEKKLSKCYESPATLSFTPLPPSPPPSYSKRRSNSTPSSLNLVLPSSRRFSENNESTTNYIFGPNEKENYILPSPPSSPSKVNQIVETFANSFRSPLDTLKKKTKLKLILRSNSVCQSSYQPDQKHFIGATENKPCRTENNAPTSPKSPDSFSNISNPLTAILNFIKPFRKVSTSESVNCDISISPSSFNPLSFVFNNDNLVIAPPCEFANDNPVPKCLNYKELYLYWINNYVLKKPNLKASYTYEGRIFYINNDIKITSWLPPPESWSIFHDINFLINNNVLLASSTTSITPEFDAIVNNKTSQKCHKSNVLPTISTTDCSKSNFDCFTITNTNQDFKSSSQIKFPYGWEEAENKDGIKYYINHNNCTTTFEFPLIVEKEDEPVPREVIIRRDDTFGFGFVAGSEKPVVVRYVQEGGPSENLLKTGDEILEINGEFVYNVAREKVISLIKSSGEQVTIKCCQPIPKNGDRKSNILSSTKKARLKQNPPRVRFADGVVVNGSPLFSPSMESITNYCSPYTPPNSDGVGPLSHNETAYPFEHLNIPLIPNVLKVFLENGQTKTFKYDSSTTVQSVLDSLYEKLGIKCTTQYGLICEQIRSMQRGNKMLLLDPNEYLSNVAARPNAHNLRCIFRVVYMLPEPVQLLSSDPATFEYLYQQCCNDIVHERYQPEIKYEIALRLSALRIFEHSVGKGFMEFSKNGKVNLKRLEGECGLDHFVPASLYQSMKRKELLKVLTHSMKLNATSLTLPGQKIMTPLTCKMQFFKILSDLPCYGGKTYANNFNNRSKTVVNVNSLNSGENEKTNTNENDLSDQVKLAEQTVDKENNKTDTSTPLQSSKKAPFIPKENIISSHLFVNESTVLISPKYGLSFLGKTLSSPVSVIRIEDVSTIKVARNENSSTEMNIYIFGVLALGSNNHGTQQMHPNTDKSLKNWSLKEPVMKLSLDTADAQEFVLLIKGYHQLLKEQSYYNNNNSIKNGGSMSTRSSTKLPFSPLQVIWESSNDEWWNDGAPRYYGIHTVIGNKWNYPFKVGQSNESNRYRVDLALAPPHYSQLSKRNKSKSNPFSLADITEIVQSIDYRDSQLYKSNYNQVDKTKENLKVSTTRPESIDMPSLVSMEILESQGVSSKKENQKDVTLRVTEMNRIFKEAEKYLTNVKNNTFNKTKELKKLEAEDNLIKTNNKTTQGQFFEQQTPINFAHMSSDSVVNNASNRSSFCNDHSSSFALQTSGSRISTLDMLPQLLQAESDLAEVARSLQTPPTAFQASDRLTKSADRLKEFSVERSPSPHRLSQLIASLEAAQQHLTSDVIDLRATPTLSATELQTDQLAMAASTCTTTAQSLPFPQIDLPLSDDRSVVQGDQSEQPLAQLNDALSDKQQQPQQQENTSDASRVAAELDHLCDTLFEMKCSLGDANLTTTKKGELNQQQSEKQEFMHEREKNKKQEQLQLQQQLLDENLLFTFDQLTASINKLILEGTERTKLTAAGKESITKMVVPPPPPDSPTQLKEQDEIIKRFWEATQDVKTLITSRKRQQLQRQEQQFECTDQKNHQTHLQSEHKQIHLHHQIKKGPDFTEFEPFIGGNSTDCTVATSGQFSSDSTAVNSSSDSESDVNLSTLAFRQPESCNSRQNNTSKYKQQQHQQHFISNPTNQYWLDQTNARFPQSGTNVNLRHHQHYQFRAPHIANTENVSYFPTTDMPYSMQQQQQQQQQQPFDENHFCQLMTANSANFGCNVDMNNQQVPSQVMQHPLEIFNIAPVLQQTTPLFPANFISFNPSMDLQSQFALSNEQLQPFIVESSSASSSPPSSGNLQPHEMIYTSPFPNHKSVSSPPASHVSNNAILPMQAQYQQSTMMVAPYDHHVEMCPSTKHNSGLQYNRSQSLTLLPTSGGQVVHLITSSTPPPIFPPSTPAVDLNSLLLGSTAPANHHYHTPPTNSSPSVTSSSQQATMNNNLVYGNYNSDRGSPRSYPKPPLPPSSPSIKEKRRQQQTQSKATFYKEMSCIVPNENQASVKSQMYPGSSSAEVLFVSNYDCAPSHPPPPYNSPQHRQHFNCNIKNCSICSSDCSTANSPTSSSTASGSCLISGSTGNSCQSDGNATGEQYFLPGMGSTVVVRKGNDGGGDSVDNISATNAVNLGSNQTTLFHSPIPESKRICFQTKEMEEIFSQSQYDIDTLLVRLEEVHESRLRQSSIKSQQQHQQQSVQKSQSSSHHLKEGCEGSPPSSARETLIVESRHFVTASKFFVKCATEGSFQLIDYLTECITLLERMFHVSETVIFEMESSAQVTCLVDRLKEVAATYAYTVDTVRRLVGFSPSVETMAEQEELADEVMIASGKRPNPFLDLLMNHATSLATCLSTLMRTLRTMN